MAPETAPDVSDDDVRHVQTTDPDFEHLNQLLSVVREQDDRGIALSLAAFAEDTLGRLLLTYLNEGKQAQDLVEGFNAPLGTLSARTKAAYAIGLLTLDQYDDLDIARRVRNAFAHDWKGVTLERQDIRSLIAQLHAYTFNQAPPKDDPRERLLSAITNILIELRVQISQHREHGQRAPFVGFRLSTQPSSGKS